MTLQFPSVSIHQDAAKIAKVIQSAGAGVVVLADLPRPDFVQLQTMFDHLSGPDGHIITDALNEAYTKNLVYKDSFANGQGGPTVDMKRVLDLSPERLEAIRSVNPSVFQHTQELTETLAYWDNLRTTTCPKLLQAVAQATGSDDVLVDAAFNYRMVDYYQRTQSEPPRCSEHRDFGTFTLVTTTGPGLQVHYQGEWHDVPPHSTVMLFGWCTQIRSNGRIPAALHRVIDSHHENHRMSMVLFCAPKQAETKLEPVVLNGEEARYISGIQVGQLRGKMARKWRHREGTLSNADKILEEDEIRTTNLKTQDDVVNHSIAV